MGTEERFRTAPTIAGPVAKGVRVTIRKLPGYFIEPDGQMPATVQARVIVNGLLAGKATVSIDAWPKNLTDEAAATEAIQYAWEVAERRMTKWRRGLEMWEAKL